MFRAGKMLADGDLKLITLALLAETPRHGYDIIKALEEKSSGFYVPSPGVVYPTLTFLEEAGYAVSAAEGTKKVFSITEEGQKHLAENRDLVERVLEQIERFGRKMAKAREWFGWNDDGEERGGHERGRSGKSDEFRAVRDTMIAMLKADGAPPTGKWSDLGYLEPVRDYRSRHTSTLLVFDAVVDALDQAEAQR